MSRTVNMTEAKYSEAFYHWYYTPRWRLIARLYRRYEWKLWLKAMADIIRKEAQQP